MTSIDIEEFAIIRINEYEYGTKRESVYLVIREFDKIAMGEAPRSPKRSLEEDTVTKVKRQKVVPFSKITSISELMPHTSGITVHVLVISRTGIVNGKFSLTVCDQSGNGGAVFRDLVPGCSCYITGARLQCVSKYRFLDMRDTAIITICEPGDYLEMVYSYTPLDDICGKASVDILCVVVDGGELVATEVGGSSTSRRSLEVVGRDGYIVSVTFWGQRAIDLTVAMGDILAIGDVLPKVFHAQYTLTCTDTSCVGQNLDNAESNALQQWWTTQSHDKTDYRRVMAISSLRTLLDTEIPLDESYYSAIAGYITIVEQGKITYNACSSCNRQLTEYAGQWLCNNCGVACSSPSLQYVLRVRVDDGHYNANMKVFGKAAVTLLGVSADDWIHLSEDDHSALFESVADHHYHITCMAHAVMNQDIVDAEYTIISVTIVDTITQTPS
ncbi:hypothetical protein BC938DRAFT_477116 [Jimgerdemannia flammicorona]|uniref:Replication factor A C-terminal domain-containing protein n=1 Tax=Jimgerdemannia flammicorona TaxID=994334 RepID=A0A433PBX6_9FUNG|nr:hypothetical protein BC938DRAFT_477116 [Jimgerdemannia flammicorona]